MQCLINKIVIDTFFEELEHTKGMAEKLRNVGLDVFVSPFVQFVSPDFKLPERFRGEEKVFAYGSIQFVKAITRKYENIIGIYSDHDYSVTEYMSKTKFNNFLNKKCIFTTFGLFKNNKDFYYELLNKDKVFIRPNSGKKVFTGLVISKNDFDYEINSLEKLSSVSNNTIILISEPKEIKNEYRFFIVNEKVISGCQYIENGAIKFIKNYPELAFKEAEKVAKLSLEEKPDIAFVCDVAELTNGIFEVIEFNALSTSDVYVCDYVEIFKSVMFELNNLYYDMIID